VFEHLRFEKNLELSDKAPEIDHKGYAGDALEPVPDRPICDRSKLHRIRTLAGYSELEYFSHPGRNRAQDGLCRSLWEAPRDKLKFAGHDLPGEVDIRAPVELCGDDGIARCRFRPHPRDMRSSIEQAFQGKCDEPFHIFGSHARIFRDDNHQRSVEVGIDILGHFCVGDDTPNGYQDHKQDDEKSMF